MYTSYTQLRNAPGGALPCSLLILVTSCPVLYRNLHLLLITNLRLGLARLNQRES